MRCAFYSYQLHSAEDKWFALGSPVRRSVLGSAGSGVTLFCPSAIPEGGVSAVGWCQMLLHPIAQLRALYVLHCQAKS